MFEKASFTLLRTTTTKKHVKQWHTTFPFADTLQVVAATHLVANAKEATIVR